MKRKNRSSPIIAIVSWENVGQVARETILAISSLATDEKEKDKFHDLHRSIKVGIWRPCNIQLLT